ncbi:MAG: NADP-dependent oxidoreductase [Gammaproteobacteria bacterium]|nr:NADP-dependent oxidoreductase [Gammaproteobacteria bacterium]MDX2461601.1 NADP-dependent oxidoreductase [Gammaproteobacteria bacterium]
MSESKHRRITLAAHPKGAPKDSDFALIEDAIRSPGAGELLLRTIYLSLDPYMRGRMNPVKSYSPFVEVGGTMVGGTVSEVMSSDVAGFAPGDLVFGYTGWQSHAIDNGKGLRKLDPEAAPISTALGILGMPGHTAYVGLLDIGRPKAGETVVVSAASGAVGSAVGQIARISECRIVGIAGAPQKCRYAVDELGFDACVSHLDPHLPARLAEACPEGIDVYYDNVGGKVLAAAFDLLNVAARVPICGMISHYNDTAPPPGPDSLPAFMRGILTRRLTIQGFIIFDHQHRWKNFHDDMAGWIRDGRVKYREDIVDGLENAPRAFQGLLKGSNFGKLIVRVGDDPTL